MGLIKREIDVEVFKDGLPEYFTAKIISTPEKLDETLGDFHMEVSRQYEVDPDDVEFKDIRVLGLQHITPLNQR